jgi:GNAT superfamily N-acetyltransferase
VYARRLQAQREACDRRPEPPSCGGRADINARRSSACGQAESNLTAELRVAGTNELGEAFEGGCANGNRLDRDVGAAQLPQETGAIRALADAYDLLATWPRRPDYLDHLLATGRVVVARGATGVIGYGGVFAGERQVHLTDLFVRANQTGRGAGGAILAALELDPKRTTTFASADPRARTLYNQLGLRQLDELSYLSGSAEDVERLRQRVERVATPEPDAERVAEQHLQLRGGLHGAATVSFLKATAQPLSWPSGYAWLRLANERVCVGPLGAEGGAVAVSVIAGALLEAVRLRPSVQIVVGRSHPAHRKLVASRFTTIAADTFMAGDDSLLDLRRYCPDPDLG